MLRKMTVFLVLAISLAILAPVALADRGDGGPHPRKVVYVTSQGLYYDTIVTSADSLPWKGKFQQLFPPGTNPDWPSGMYLSTEFGPGDPGHRGGRWWVDANGNGYQDEGDAYFSCPLLGPGCVSP